MDVFFQDDIKVSSKLTMNLGVRLERNGVSARFGIGNLQPGGSPARRQRRNQRFSKGSPQQLL